MSKLSHNQIIDDLASYYGIEPEYLDNWGRVQQTPFEIKQNILKAIGVKTDTVAQANETWHLKQEHEWSRMTDTTIVTNFSSMPKELVFQIPLRKAQCTSTGPAIKDLEVSLEVTDEQGKIQHFVLSNDKLSFYERKKVGRFEYERWGVPFPQFNTLGYYQVCLSANTGNYHRTKNIFIAICPEKAFIPPALQGDRRSAGISLSLYGVRSKNNWGIGDFGDLKRVVGWVAKDLNGGVVGLNPLHATFNRRPYNTSPYLPLSRFYRNFIYLDISNMEDYRDSQEAQGFVKTAETQRLLSELRTSEMVMYEQVAALKQKVLMMVFKTFLENHWNRPGENTDRQREFENYIEGEGFLLDNFATFCALDSYIHSTNSNLWTWSQWPPEYQRPDTEAVRKFQRKHWKKILFYKYLQWQLEKQLAQIQDYAKSQGMIIGLYHDLALAIDRFSADFWAYKDFFISKLRVGAPPDAFSQNGQDWGFPPPATDKMRENGYKLFIKEIRKNCAFGGALRIDHVMRFFHLYCIPEDKPPREGAYVSQPFDDLLGIVALESVRNRVLIIGEDLGTVSPFIRKRLTKANIFSYRLLYFEKDNNQSFILPEDYPKLALVTVTTHDLPTLTGFWTNRDIEVRKEAGMFDSKQAIIEAVAERAIDKKKLLKLFKELGLLPGHCSTDINDYPQITGDLHNAVVGFLAMTPSKLFILGQQDLFKETEQQNLPGTTIEYPNWSLKTKYILEEFRSDSEFKGFSDMFKNWIKRSERGNPS